MASLLLGGGSHERWGAQTYARAKPRSMPLPPSSTQVQSLLCGGLHWPAAPSRRPKPHTRAPLRPCPCRHPRTGPRAPQPAHSHGGERARSSPAAPPPQPPFPNCHNRPRCHGCGCSCGCSCTQTKGSKRPPVATCGSVVPTCLQVERKMMVRALRWLRTKDHSTSSLRAASTTM